MTTLDYLLFDSADEESGACSFDAMASALPQRLPALLSEVEAVLAWAHEAFGAPDPDAGEWDCELRAHDESDLPLAIACVSGKVRLSRPDPDHGRVTVTLTLSGSAAFAEAFRAAFPPSE